MKSLISAALLAAALFQVPSFLVSESPQAPNASAALIGKSWRAEDINGGGVIDDARTYVHFENATKVSGSGGANRFTATCTLDGSKVSFGELMSTKRMAAPALMNQERAFFQALAATRTFKMDENGLLHFLDKDGKELVRMAKEDQP